MYLCAVNVSSIRVSSTLPRISPSELDSTSQLFSSISRELSINLLLRNVEVNVKAIDVRRNAQKFLLKLLHNGILSMAIKKSSISRRLKIVLNYGIILVSLFLEIEFYLAISILI